MIILTSRRMVNVLSLNFASAMALYPFILLKENACKDNPVLINHEKIHLRQQAELGIVFFYLWYSLEFLYGLLRFRNRREAYNRISFEREAYAHEHDLDYLNRRPFWNFLRYFSLR